MEIDDYCLVKEIGEGAFGKVYKTTKKGTNQIFATKKMKIEKINQGNMKKYFNNEINILRETHHDSIIKLYDVLSNKHFYFLVFENCNGGGLSDCLEKYKKKYKKPFTEVQCISIFRQIVDALQYLHSNRIIHRDLKLDNILVNFDNEEDKENLNMEKAKVKIIDFGFARYLPKGEMAKSVLGSPINMDPKILFKMRKVENKLGFGYDMKADIWSLGTCCYEMLTGNPPFNASSFNELIDKIKIGSIGFDKELQLSTECISFINAMLQIDENKRKDIDYLKQHPFLNEDHNNFHEVLLTSVFQPNDDLNINIKDTGIWSGIEAKSLKNGKIINCNEQMLEYPAKPIHNQKEIVVGDKDYLEDEDAEFNTNFSKEDLNKDFTISNNSNFVLTDAFKKMILDEFDNANNYKCVDVMFAPLPPNNDNKIFDIEL